MACSAIFPIKIGRLMTKSSGTAGLCGAKDLTQQFVHQVWLVCTSYVVLWMNTIVCVCPP